MKKAITLFLSIAIIGIVTSQIAVKDKTKSVVQKDTVKNEKVVQPRVIFNDSVIAIKGTV
jgi:hypothetical protein